MAEFVVDLWFGMWIVAALLMALPPLIAGFIAYRMLKLDRTLKEFHSRPMDMRLLDWWAPELLEREQQLKKEEEKRGH